MVLILVLYFSVLTAALLISILKNQLKIKEYEETVIWNFTAKGVIFRDEVAQLQKKLQEI